MAYNNVRIQQKFDTLENWNKDEITLLKGELAVVVCNNQIRFKIGNGISAFTELPFVDETQLSTKQVFAQTISQGINNKSAPYGIAAGAYLSTDSNFSQAFGVNAQVSSADPFSFVWSGDDSGAAGEDPYTSHGKGTFSLNPLEGISGVYIGDRDLCAIIGDEDTSIRNELCATSCYLSTDILSLSNYVDGLEVAIFGGDKNRDVTYLIPLFRFRDAINNIDDKIGHPQLPEDADIYEVRDNVLDIYNHYGIPQPEIDTLGDLFRSLNDVIFSTDLSTDYTFTIKFALEQLNADFCRLNLDATIMSSNIETLCANAATHINEEQSKYWHYMKNETSSAIQLSVAFDSIDLSNVYKKWETSSAAEISTAFDSIDLSNVYKKWETSSDVEIQNEFDTKTTALSATTIANNCANNRVNQFQEQFAGIAPLDANSSIEDIANTLNAILAFLKPQQPTP